MDSVGKPLLFLVPVSGREVMDMNLKRVVINCFIFFPFGRKIPEIQLVHVYDHCPTEVSTFNLTVAFQVQ